jgi:hypothetical protein
VSPCRSSRAARRAGSSTSSTSTPRCSPTSRRPRARSRCSAPSSRPTTPRSSTGIDPGRHRHGGPDALLGQEVRVQPARDVRQRLQGRRLRPDHARAGQMIQRGRHRSAGMPKSDFDDPFGTATGSGVIFGATGGVMEAALRTVIELVTGQEGRELLRPRRHHAGARLRGHPLRRDSPIPRRSARCRTARTAPGPDWDWLKGATLKVAVAHGTANAKKVMEDIKAGGKFSECHFIEFMACPGRLPGRRRPADPDLPGDPQGAGPGHLRRGLRPTRSASRTRTPGGHASSTRSS